MSLSQKNYLIWNHPMNKPAELIERAAPFRIAGGIVPIDIETTSTLLKLLNDMFDHISSMGEWRPIEQADQNGWYILYSPLVNEPELRITVGCPSWTPASSHFMPLPTKPGV